MPINSIYEGNDYKNNLTGVVKINLISYNCLGFNERRYIWELSNEQSEM